MLNAAVDQSLSPTGRIPSATPNLQCLSPLPAADRAKLHQIVLVQSGCAEAVARLNTMDISPLEGRIEGIPAVEERTVCENLDDFKRLCKALMVDHAAGLKGPDLRERQTQLSVALLRMDGSPLDKYQALLAHDIVMRKIDES